LARGRLEGSRSFTPPLLACLSAKRDKPLLARRLTRSRAVSGFYRVKLAAVGLFGQLAPLSGNIQQAVFRVAIARAFCLLLSLEGMLTELFGSFHGRFPPCP
jgi:hypothetical protein